MKSQPPTAKPQQYSKSQLPTRRQPGKAVILGLIAAFPVIADDGTVRLGGPKAEQPQAVVARDGRAYVVWAEEDDIRCAVAPKIGAAFGEPVKVGTVTRLMSGMRRGPRVAADGKTVVVTAIGMNAGDLVAWRSEDGGVVWTDPVTVNGRPGAAREGLQDLAAGKAGRFHAAWLDLRSGKTQIWAASSADGGRTWAEAKAYESPSGKVCECCHPSIAADVRGRVAILFRNALDGNRDMHRIDSPDDGRTWGKTVKLGTGTWSLGSCPMQGGRIAAASGGKENAVWVREEDVFLTGPGGGERRIGKGLSPWLAEGPGGVWAVWQREKTGGGIQILRPGGKPERLEEEGAWPVIAGGPDAGVIAAWESGGGICVRRLSKPKN